MSTHNSQDDRLSFRRLREDIIDKGKCAMCYGCVSFCSANDLHVLTIIDDRPAYNEEGVCLKCGICHLICPRTPDLDEALKTHSKYGEPIGYYDAIRSLRTTDEKISEVCCDGGVVSSILWYLLENGRIDGAIVSKRAGLWNNEPMIATSYEDLLECAGSSLSHSASISDMGYLTTYASIFNVIKGSRRLDLAKLAVVGTPCQIQTIRKMQLLRIVPSHLVYFTIGLFCFENFYLHEAGIPFLEEKIGDKLEHILKINLKDDFTATLDDGRTIHIDLDELKPIVRPACLACADFSNFAADISVGGLGSPTGYTTTVLRSRIGKTIVNEAVNLGYLREADIGRPDTLSAIEQMARRKRQRSETFSVEGGLP
jgi:coenzyme F420 hydrogenase subunit beta